MKQVTIDNLAPGMILAEDLTAQGRLLLPEGATLQAGHIKTFKAWGVSSAGIQTSEAAGETPEPSAEVDGTRFEQSRQLLKPLFSLTSGTCPVMTVLEELAVQRTAHRLAGGWNPPANWNGADCQHLPSMPAVGQSSRDLVRGEVQLAALPDVYLRIVQVLNAPTSNAGHIASVVSKDSSLAARLLKLVNSAFYGFPGRIDSIQRAVALVGGNELSTLALGVSMLRIFDDIPAEIFDMQGFWKHSIACGVLGRLLAAHKPGLSEEGFFVGGLLHDIGRLLLYRRAPQAAIASRKEAWARTIPLHQAERELLGYDHARLGAMLCQEWHLPKTLERMLGAHHRPVREHFAIEASIIHLADIMAQTLLCDQVTEVFIPPLQAEAWTSLGLSTEIFDAVFIQAEQQIDSVVSIFLDPPGSTEHRGAS